MLNNSWKHANISTMWQFTQFSKLITKQAKKKVLGKQEHAITAKENYVAEDLLYKKKNDFCITFNNNQVRKNFSKTISRSNYKVLMKSCKLQIFADDEHML